MKKKITNCEECGEEIEYKTNKPKRCKKCKNKAAASKRKKNHRSNKRKKNPDWSKEYFMFQILDGIFPGESYIRNGYYSFLISPKGEPMQLDIYYPNRKLALE